MTTTLGTTPNGRKVNKPIITEFTHYCIEFYSLDYDGALYPFAANEEIFDAVYAHLSDPNPLFPFDGDSADREAVRDRILEKRRLIGVGETDFDRAVELARIGIV